MKKIIFVLIGIMLVCSSFLIANQKEKKSEKKGNNIEISENQRPNIVFFFADDLGFGDVRCNNPESKIPTPNIDKLAEQGMRFTDAHSVGSLCAPSRFGLLTGRNPVNWTNYVNIESDSWECLTMPEMLQKQGYYTACIGKWHFGVLFEGKDGRWGGPNPVGKRFPKPADNWILTAETRLGPTDRGFDYFFGTPLQPGGKWYANMEGNQLLGNPKLSPDLPATDDFDVQKWMRIILNKTVNKIHELSKKEQPFFLYFPINSPHKPIVPEDSFIGKTGIGKYGDYCNQVDWCFGEVAKAIDEAGIAKNTIFIFTSDNGSYYYPHSVNSNKQDEKELKKNKHKANGEFKAGKGQPEEGGHRIPYIVRWPGHIEPGIVNETAISLGDHFATFAAITDYQLASDDAIDSWNILPLWKGTSSDIDYSNRTIFHFNNNPRVDAVRHGKWKLIPECFYKEKKSKKDGKKKLTKIAGQLYDLSTDPGEQVNLWDKHPEVVKELSSMLENYHERRFDAPHVK